MRTKHIVALLCGMAVLAHSRPGNGAESSDTALPVDLELVIAADTSGSVSPSLLTAQRAGFADAFRNPRLQRAMFSGPNQRVAAVYFEWSDARKQRIVVPWTLLEDPGDMSAFAAELDRARAAPPGGETSISGAISFARQLVRMNEFGGLRQVIDLAGNGRNTAGPPLPISRGGLWQDGITVNGLILPGGDYDENGPYGMLFSDFDGPLERYFQTEVIGGPGAFVHVVDPEQGFEAAILRKLVLEVAWSH